MKDVLDSSHDSSKLSKNILNIIKPIQTEWLIGNNNTLIIF